MSLFYRDFKLAAEDGLMVFMEQLLKTPQGATQLARARAAVAAVEARDRAGCLLNKLKTVYKQVVSLFLFFLQPWFCFSASPFSFVFFLYNKVQRTFSVHKQGSYRFHLCKT